LDATQSSRLLKLKRFFMRSMARSGKNVAAVELARKILCILSHLLMKQEDYQEPEVNKTKPIRSSFISPVSMMNIDEMIKIISKAGYRMEKDLKEDGGDRTILFC
jgi:transposase